MVKSLSCMVALPLTGFKGMAKPPIMVLLLAVHFLLALLLRVLMIVYLSLLPSLAPVVMSPGGHPLLMRTHVSFHFKSNVLPLRSVKLFLILVPISTLISELLWLATRSISVGFVFTLSHIRMLRCPSLPKSMLLVGAKSGVKAGNERLWNVHSDCGKQSNADLFLHLLFPVLSR